VLDLPDRVEAGAVGDLDLLERVVQEAVLAVVAPRSRELVLVEDAEAHARGRLIAARVGAGLRVSGAGAPGRGGARGCRTLEGPRGAGAFRSKPVSRILS
jgi:hypothetical protein